MKLTISSYLSKLKNVLKEENFDTVQLLANEMLTAWRNEKNIFICGNGGSAGNANHLANDFIFGAGKKKGKGLKIESLCANSSVITCLANDLGYENIFSEQIRVKASRGDLLIVLSGSGNSSNVIKALELGNQMGMETFAILGFNGGRCKDLASVSIHFAIEDMQMAEDLQLIVGHMCMQWLANQDW